MRRLIVAALLTGCAVLGPATPAFAHNVLIGSQPSTGATLTTGPTEIRLNFNAPIRTGPNTIKVIGPNGTHWERSENATVDGNSVTTPVVPLGPAGLYTASYAIVSTDGHPVSGDITFTLTKAGNGTPVTLAAAQTGGGGGIPVWVWIIGAAVLLAVVLVIALRPGRRPDGPQEA